MIKLTNEHFRELLYALIWLGVVAIFLSFWDELNPLVRWPIAVLLTLAPPALFWRIWR
jgi:hypothetical protein